MGSKKLTVGIVIAIVAIIGLSIAGRLLENNRQGYYQTKQAPVSGEMTVRMTPGLYWQGLGEIHTYKAVATIGIGDEKGEGSADIPAVKVTFNDGSKAGMSALVRVALPSDPDKILELKKMNAQGYDHFIRSALVPIISNVIKLSANLRSAQDAYTTVALFQQDVQDQLENGIYVTKSAIKTVTRATGDKEEFKVTEVVTEKDGITPVRLSNKLTELGCTVEQCVISIPEFDEQVTKSIAKRKEAAMATELAKQEAIKAKQDAITAAEKGKASVATAKYTEEVEKIKAVTVASKEYEVEQFAAKKALETAKKIKAKGMAEAAANRALVAAGLTPQQKMTLELKKADVISKNLSTMVGPKIVMMGKGESSGGILSMLGAKMGLDLYKEFEKVTTE